MPGSKDNQRSVKLLKAGTDFNPPFATDLFFVSSFPGLTETKDNGSTGCKQTLNGLFIFLFKSSSAVSLLTQPDRWNSLLRL
ncbi:MAG TPA: hypothetical protein VK772_17410 [Puia sp.]|nr:hypothetical protein [Puia sp.]